MAAPRGLWDRTRELGRALGESVVDTGQAAVYLRQLMRGNRAAPSLVDLPRGPASSTPPVLLIHGFMANRGAVHLLERRLSERHHVVMTYRLGPLHLGDIRDSAAFIAGKVQSLTAQTGVPQVDIVAHSMGGLVALDYVKRHGGWQKVRRLVLLGTPSHGTWSALLGIVAAPLGRGGRQLLPGSDFLRDLESAPLPPGPQVITVAGSRDWLAPPSTTAVAGARHLEVASGHSGLLVDEAVADTIAAILAAPNDRSAASGGEPAAKIV